MAENEYLDSTKARRWHSVAQSICNGAPIEEVVERVEDCLFKTLREISRELPLGQMIELLDDPEELEEFCNQVGGGLDVKDFLIDAAHSESNRAAQVLQFLQRALENCLYDIPYLAAERDGSANISESRNTLNHAVGHLAHELSRIASKLAANPHWIPRRKAVAKKISPHDKTLAMLSESLLSGRKR